MPIATIKVTYVVERGSFIDVPKAISRPASTKLTEARTKSKAAPSAMMASSFRKRVSIHFFVDSGVSFITAFEMFRLFAVYSVIKQKQVSEINTFVCNEIFPLLKDGCTSEAIAQKIDDKLNGDNGWSVLRFNEFLCEGADGGLYSNYKRAALICVMSELVAMLEEEKRDDHIREALFSWGNKTSLEDAKGKKYNGKYNCDHILARDLFKGSYKTKFNGIGNLVLLSDSDNKSAKNKEPKEKAEDHYKTQNIFVEPRKIAEIIIAEKGWDEARIDARQNERAAKILEFLRLDETGVKPYDVPAHDVDPKNVDGGTE